MAANKLNDLQIKWIVAQRINFKSFRQIVEGLKEKWPETEAVSIPNIAYHCRVHEDEIIKGQCELDKQIARLPLAHKYLRVLELIGIYNTTLDKKILLQVLAQIRAEVGEDVDKIALALSKSGGHNVLNIALNVTGEELDRVIAEQAKTCGLNVPQDRFKLA